MITIASSKKFRIYSFAPRLKWLLLVMVILLNRGESHGQWYPLSVGTVQDLYSVNYYSGFDIWIGSSNQFVRTSNGGASWTVVNPMMDNFGFSLIGEVYDMELISSTSALATGLYFIGNDEVIMSTANSGAWWNYASIYSSGPLLSYLNAIDRVGPVCVAVGNHGRIGRSSNSGSSWNFVSSGTPNLITDVKFISTDTVVAAGTGVILKSTNAGLNWLTTLINGSIHSLSYAQGILYAGEEFSPILYRSVNGGDTFDTLSLPFYSTGVVYAISSDTVLLAGEEGLYISKSGGQYWEKYNLPGYRDINMIDFNNNSGVAVGDSGYYIKTVSISITPSYPIPSFVIQSSFPYCFGDSLTLGNNTVPVPGYSYDWKFDNVTFSTQYNSTLYLNSPGVHTISLTVTNSFGSTTVSEQVTITGHDLLPFTLGAVTDTICTGNPAVLIVPDSQTGVTYQLRNGFANIGNAQAGNGDTLAFSSLTNIFSTTIFNVLAVRINNCFTDSVIENKTILVAAGSPPVACLPAGGNIYGITNFSLNTINHSTPATGGFYNDYSCLISTNLVVGDTYPASISSNAFGRFHIWIDLDNSGSFNGTNEMFMSNGTSGWSTSGTITIPITHQLFNTPLRLRVAFGFNTFPFSPCGQGFLNGQFEDYSVIVQPAAVPPVAAFSFNASTTCLTQVTFTNTTYNATFYMWDFGDGNSSTLLNPTHTYTNSGVYTITLTAFNITGANTITQSITVQNPVVPSPASCGFTAYPSSCDRKLIKAMSLNGVSNPATANSTLFYEDFTCTYQAHLYRDSTYQITYNVRDLSSNNCSGFSNVWIDFDGDGILNNANERLLSGQSFICPTMFFNFTIPNNTPLDTPLRMRIAVGENSVTTMCSSLCGQYEDYTIFIHLYPFTNVALPDDQTRFNIYPNPGTGIFNLDAKAGTLEVFDYTGKLLMRKELAGNSSTLDLSEYDNGVYLVALRNHETVKWKKIILAKE